jgi:hypothetical protein
MLQQTKTSGKDEIVLEMEEQIRIVTLCHNCRNLFETDGEEKTSEGDSESD